MKSNMTLFVALTLTFAASIAMADTPPEPQTTESGKHQGPTDGQKPAPRKACPAGGRQAAGATPLAPYEGTRLNPKINTKLQIALFPRRCA